MAENSIGVCLLGCGVVGTGVVRILHDQADMIRQRTGKQFILRHIVVRDTDRQRVVPHGLVHADAERAIDDPATQIVIELIGGTDAAGTLVERALRLGKPVITANKSLLASKGPQLFALARKHGACIGFEASCAGGVPIINAITHGLVANRIDALVGIVNGTCNFILSQMTRNGWDYGHALAEAQKAGFAEADPTLDVSGRDSAQKLALLATLAFNALVKESDIHIEGINSLQDADIHYARKLGYVIKLLAIAQRHGEKLSLRVHPTLVHNDDLLADVSGSFNAVSVYGNALGHTLFYGRGAGQMPTASAVIADLVMVGLGLTGLAFKQLNIFSDNMLPASVLPFRELRSRYYLRLMARDEPGVIAQITSVLGQNGISLSAILQREVNGGQFVPVVITTHMANEGQMQASIAALNKLPAIGGSLQYIRLIDHPKEFANA